MSEHRPMCGACKGTGYQHGWAGGDLVPIVPRFSCSVCGGDGGRSIRPEVAALIRGISHRRSNIAALHFDGPGLDEPLRLQAALMASYEVRR